jgi:uncharacterized protein (DUF433 family)
MEEQQLLDRITFNPKVMVGKPVIKGTRLTVEYILGLLAHGTTGAEILKEYNGLVQEDIQACLLFAAQSLENTAFMPLTVEMT